MGGTHTSILFGLILVGAIGLLVDGFAERRAVPYTAALEMIAEQHGGSNLGAHNRRRCDDRKERLDRKRPAVVHNRPRDGKKDDDVEATVAVPLEEHAFELDEHVDRHRTELQQKKIGQPVSWTLRAGGIFTCYYTSHDDEHFRISFRTLTDTHEEVVLQTTSRPGLRFDISPDGRFIVFDRVTHSESDIIGLRSPQRTL